MKWGNGLAAIRLTSSDGVHIADESPVHPPSNRYLVNVKTRCGLLIEKPFEECTEDDVDCDACIAESERIQTYWREFYASPEGINVIKILSGYDKIEREREAEHRRVDAFIREMEAFNHMLESCLKHKQPVFTLELPDDILLKLLDYGCVGEVLLAFKWKDETRQSLKDRVGKEGFALLGSRLISKGLLRANDPIFNTKW